MQLVRLSSFEDYAAWYLARERRKDHERRKDPIPNPVASPDPVVTMQTAHEGKVRPWFKSARWSIVSIDTIEEFAKLVFLESGWTRYEGLVVPDQGANYRILRRVAQNALSKDYLARRSAERHKKYYDRLGNGSLQLRDDDRIAICSAEQSELDQNPAARYYLLDGVGRCLPYMMMLIKSGVKPFRPIEAFCADRQ